MKGHKMRRKIKDGLRKRGVDFNTQKTVGNEK